jgi:hypothetical protein
VSIRPNPTRLAEIVGFVVLLMAVPITVIGLALPVNEYSWMASEGTVPPDCDIVTGMFLLPAGIAFLGGLLGFGLLLSRRRSKLRLVGVVLSIVMLLGIGLKLPEYFRETARASQLCSK